MNSVARSGKMGAMPGFSDILAWALVAIYPIMAWVAYANIPYILWVSFASVLQLTVTYLNR